MRTGKLRHTLLSTAVALAVVPPALTQEPTVAQLIADLDAKDKRARSAARDQLLSGGSDTADAFVALLNSGALSERQQIRVLDMLADLGPLATAAAPRVVQELEDVSDEDGERIGTLLRATAEILPFARQDREDALETLAGRVQLIHKDSTAYVRAYSRLQLDVEAPISELRTWLQSSNPYDREFAAVLLGAQGYAARAAVPALTEARDDKSGQPFNIGGPNWSHSASGGSTSSVRRAAAIALARIAPHDPEAVRGLRYLLDDGRAVDRARAARSLAAFGPDAAPAVPGLIAHLRDPDPRVVREAITALGVVGPEASKAKWELEELTSHDDKQIAARARAALRQIQAPSEGR